MSAPLPPSPDDASWHRLSARMIWVDLGQSLVSPAPGALAVGLTATGSRAPRSSDAAACSSGGTDRCGTTGRQR